MSGPEILEPDLLRTFVAIAETGSFSSAASSVGRTPSAISMQVKRLEGIVGRPLFEREGRSGVRLTIDGETLLGYARRILKLHREALGVFHETSLTGTVRIGTPDDFATRFLPEALALFARTHPAVQVEVICELSVKLVPKIVRGALDLALVTQGPETADHAEREVVHSEPLVWAGATHGDAHLQRPLPLALSSPGCNWRSAAVRSLDAVGISYRIAYSSPHYAGQLAAIGAGLAVAPVPPSIVTPDLQVLGWKEGLPPLPDYRMELHRATNRPPAADALALHLKASLDGIRARAVA